MPRAAFILLIALLSPAARAAALPHVDLSRAGPDWRVHYVFDAPVREFRFAREDAKGRRAALWQAEDAAVVITLEDGEEVVRRKDGEAFDEAAFTMAPGYVPLDKDYAPFSPFGDGGLLIHTGRFFACAPRCGDDDAASWSFTVEAAGMRVLHEGAVHEDAVAFVDRDSGTNLYVGTTTPVESAHVLAVIDEKMPRATRRMLERTFPKLMDFYARKLGPLPRKPMLFVSNDEAHPGGGSGRQGGTLPGQIFMHWYGKPAEASDPRAGADAVRGFFAHEAAHLFQHYEAGRDQANAWLHEGGADAFALLALEQLGLLRAGEREKQIAAALAQCDAGTRGTTLTSSAVRSAFDNYYRCGLLMHLAVDAAARRQSAGSCDLFCVWRDFLSRVGAGADWSAETFYAVVDEQAGKTTGRFLREAAMTAQADPRAFYLRGLAAAGVAAAAAR